MFSRSDSIHLSGNELKQAVITENEAVFSHNVSPQSRSACIEEFLRYYSEL